MMNSENLLLSNNEIDYLSIDNFENTGLVKAFFTLKSTPEWKINFAGNEGLFQNTLAASTSSKSPQRPAIDFSKFDDYSQKSSANFSQLAKILNIPNDHLVRCDQTHTANVEVVTGANAGEGITRPIVQANVDGMVTNEKGMLLCTLEADCVPVYFLDPVKKAIGMVHSGWRGTAAKISKTAIDLMVGTYGSDPKDLLVCTGPCICGDCYEVSEDLLAPFAENFSYEEMGYVKENTDLSKGEIEFTKDNINTFFTPKGNGKYLLDLVKAINVTLTSCGVRQENISTCGLCTFHDERLCSYRRDKDPQYRMLTALMLL